MNLNDEEKKLEKKCNDVQDKIIKDNILLVYNKISSKKNQSEYKIEISFPNNLDKNSKQDLEFILIINIVNKTIILFSKNINPISDGRDILPLISNVTNMTNHFSSLDDINLLDIVNNIKKFLEAKQFLNLNSIFYIGEEYDPKIIDSFENIEKIKCNHLEKVNGKEEEIPCLCTISDDNFCLYEKSLNKYNLVFYSNLKNILSFVISICSIVTITWKKKIFNKNKEDQFYSFDLQIKSNRDEDMRKVMNILIEKIKKIGYKMNINEPKKGSLPDINVGKIEGEITRLESQIKNKDNILVFNKLLENYEKVIEYYSAANNNKYIEYNTKMKELLKNEKYSKYIN